MNSYWVTVSTFLLALHQLSSQPTGFVLVEGKAEAPYIDSSGAMVVESGKQAVIDWTSFSIGQQEIMRFLQQDRHSSVLNRVTGKEQSQILGQLQSNGKLFLINPQGVIVGPSGVVQTAGFFASTAEISSDDFFKNLELNLTQFGEGEIVNLGTIECLSGDVALFAKIVKNEGSILTPQGSAFLGAAAELVLKPEGTQRLFIKVASDRAQINSSGLIEAVSAELKAGGDPYSMAICHTGRVEASHLIERGGRLYLSAENSGIQMAGEVVLPGGEVEIVSHDLFFDPSLRIDVSSDKGDGGEVTAVARGKGAFFGFIDASARGPIGNGGDVKLCLQEGSYQAQTLLLSANGEIGRLVLDPKNINITAVGIDPATGQTFASNPAGTVNISGSTLSSAINLASVVLQANNDVTISDNVAAGVAGNGLSLQAGRSITVDPGITIALNGGNFHATVNDAGAQPLNRDAGPALFQMNAGSQILTQGGNVTLTAGNFGGSTVGEIVITGVGALINADSGTISMIGVGNSIAGVHPGITVDAGANVITTSGSINMAGTSGSQTTAFNRGLLVDNATIRTGDGVLSLTGIGAGSADHNYGLTIQNGGVVEAIAGGTIVLQGTGSNGTDSNIGIVVEGVGSTVSTQGGDIHLTGTGQGTGLRGSGIHLALSASITTNGLGSVFLTGTGSSSGSDQCNGIEMSNLNTSISTLNGPIQLMGIANGSGVQSSGIQMMDHINISSTTGSIMLSGIGSYGTDDNTGITLQGNSDISTDAGLISLIGTSNGGGINNQGVVLDASTLSSISGNIKVIGTGSLGSSTNIGIHMVGATATVETVNGILEMTGIGGAPDSYGLFVNTQPVIQATGNGSIVLKTTRGDIGLDHLATVDVQGGGGLTIESERDIQIFSSVVTISSGSSNQTMQLMAGRNIVMKDNGMGAAQLTHRGTGNLFLVTDNEFPVFPGIGPGGFSSDATSVISTASGQLRIYTATPGQNQVLSLLNGDPFIPGPFGIDTATEKWKIYFPNGSYSDLSAAALGGVDAVPTNFTLYYKAPITLTPTFPAHFPFVATLGISQLFILINDTYTYPKRFPYHGQFCAPKQEGCFPTFDPHGSFIFEDSVDWVKRESF